LKSSINKDLKCSSCGASLNVSSVVVSRGNPNADLMIIGEAPGAIEQEIGEPFLGRSGKLLDLLLNQVGIDPDREVYICNVIKCKPLKNRRPTKAEIKRNKPWLLQQIKLVNPLIIVLAGSTALEAVLGIKKGISAIRGTWQSWEGRLVMPLFHPSYLLRNPSKKDGAPTSLTLSDLLQVSEKLKNP
tara:strand:- start:4272 stop:4832 length:561 start_codon:yes stop_codon:yes gene_type:complete